MVIYNIQSTIYNRRRAAFTLVELMIVVAILGILAAIVLPEFQSHTQQAKEAAAKDNLRILREAIERYANDHNDVPPGYLSNDMSTTPTPAMTRLKLVKTYLSKIPINPFNGLNTLTVIHNQLPFPNTPDGPTGWIYKPLTKEIRVNYVGTDSNNISYFSY